MAPQMHIDELRALWAAATWEANVALDAWRTTPGRDAYVTFRAAEDRADAAMDQLASLSR